MQSGSDAHPLVVELVDRLRSRGATVGFAESCSGGLLSSMVTHHPGVSDVFVGSIIAYSYQIKEDLLGVPSSLLRVAGAVSLPVARRMAEGARRSLHTTWAVSITGIAGPGGGTPQKPIGTVCFGVCGPGVDKVDQQQFSGGRREIQEASAEYALRLLLSELGWTEEAAREDDSE